MLNFLKNIGNAISGKYYTHPEAVIVACYFNSQDNPYRKIAFDIWYDSIKHLNHRIIECTINGSTPQLPKSEFIEVIDASSMLWHKESLLNLAVSKLPVKFKYVFWLDTDVLFTNKKWLLDGVKELQTNNLIQPFEYCTHLNRDEKEYSGYSTIKYRADRTVINLKMNEPVSDITCWRSYCANNASGQSAHKHYDIHGHVGFAWGARREVLDAVPLYDKALIGGADHIIAHAGSGHINHSCIAKSFTENIDEVNEWSERFYAVVQNKIGYVKGDLLHIWHGDIKKREYYQRIKEFTPVTKSITKKDKHGLHVTEDDSYVKNYFDRREVKSAKAQAEDEASKRVEFRTQLRAGLQTKYPDKDDSFIESLLIGYITDSSVIGSLMGGNPMGAIIGDILNTHDNTFESTGFQDGFGGGDFSGSGAGDDFLTPDTTNNDTDNNYMGSSFS